MRWMGQVDDYQIGPASPVTNGTAGWAHVGHKFSWQHLPRHIDSRIARQSLWLSALSAIASLAATNSPCMRPALAPRYLNSLLESDPAGLATAKRHQQIDEEAVLGALSQLFAAPFTELGARFECFR